MKAFPAVRSVLTICLLLLAPPFLMQAGAYNYGASVSYQNPGFVYDSQQTAASLNSTTTNGFAAASAGFYAAAPVVSATANAYTGYTQASASIGDWLLFSGPSGSYADVTIHIAGNWGVYLDRTAAPGTAPWVRFSVGFTPQWSSIANTYDSWRSWYSGGIQQSGSLTATGGWTEFAGGDDSNASGTYAFDFTTRVYYGYYYHLTLGVTAEATAGQHRAYIDDPLIIALSDGVTFTSLSGTKYTAVPVPSSFLLIAPCLIGLAAVRRRFRK
jgi:hypothetical protein